MILTVEPAGYADAVAGLQAGNRLAATVHDDLVAGWSSLGGMAGDDPAAIDVASAYDQAAAEAGDAIADVVAAFTTLGRLAERSLRNHERAEERSIMVGAVVSGPDVAPPVAPRSVLRARPPTSLGGDSPALTQREAWVLDHVAGFVWPGADLDRLREAARLWRRTAQALDVLVEQCTRVTVALETQRSPEIPLATAAVDDLGLSIRDLASSCDALAAQCESYADTVEQHRAAIMSLVREIMLFVVEGMVIGALIGAFTAGAGTAVASGAVASRVALQSPRFASILASLRGVTTSIAGSLRLTRDALQLRRTRLERFLGVPVRGERGAFGPPRGRGWLQRHENLGGHVKVRHVGKSEAELRSRVARGRPNRASTFRTEGAAERILKSALERRNQEVTAWLKSDRDELLLSVRFPESTGLSVTRGGPLESVTSVRILLLRDPRLPEGYRIHTAYPQP